MSDSLDPLTGGIRHLTPDRGVEHFDPRRSPREIGRHIVEFEQAASRPEYGSRSLPTLAAAFTAKFGRGFDASNLRYIKLFYQSFPICDGDE